MSWMKVVCWLSLGGLIGCGIPPVDSRLISTTPADAESFAVARRAVRACVDPINGAKTRRNFERAGFGVSTHVVTAGNGKKISRTVIAAPDPSVTVLYLGQSCYVGLEGMTPAQSAQLAQIWADAHDAPSNATYGDGLSDHVSGAWRRLFTEPARPPHKASYRHKIYITAYKTWPQGPYDPKRTVIYDIPAFPDTPGAAVKINHVLECRSMKTSETPPVGVWPCSGPDYAPK